MPYGKGTYGSKMGRPPKKEMKKKPKANPMKKMMMPKRTIRGR